MTPPAQQALEQQQQQQDARVNVPAAGVIPTGGWQQLCRCLDVQQSQLSVFGEHVRDCCRLVGVCWLWCPLLLEAVTSYSRCTSGSTRRQTGAAGCKATQSPGKQLCGSSEFGLGLWLCASFASDVEASATWTATPTRALNLALLWE